MERDGNPRLVLANCPPPVVTENVTGAFTMGEPPFVTLTISACGVNVPRLAGLVVAADQDKRWRDRRPTLAIVIRGIVALLIILQQSQSITVRTGRRIEADSLEIIGLPPMLEPPESGPD